LERRAFDEDFFGAEFFGANKYKIGNLKFSDLVFVNGMKPWVDFVTDTGIRIPEEKFEVIRRSGLDLLEGGEGGALRIQ
jgi:hypothetical protein